MSTPDNRKVPEGPTRMTPSEAFVETMVANGVTDMFGIMGSAFMDAMDIFAPAGIRLIPVVHEQGAGHMADGYARVSGRHGVVIGQNGPGISNCVTAIAAAYWAHSPVVIVTPRDRHHGHGPGRLPGSQPAADVPGIHQVPGPREQSQAHGRVHRPLLRPRHERNGPDPAQHPARLLSTATSPARSPSPRASTAAPAANEPRTKPPNCWPRPSSRSSSPAAAWSWPTRVEECKALAERLGAPVVNSYLHNDSFPASHPLWCGPLGYQGSKAGDEADGAGRRGDRAGQPPRPLRHPAAARHGLLAQEAKIIQIDADHKMLGLVKKISVGICGDAKAAAVALTKRLAGRTLACDATKADAPPPSPAEKPPGKRSSTTGPTSATLQPGHDRRERQGEDLQRRHYLHPRQVLRELEKAMPPDVMVSTDIGNINSVANSYLRFEKPRSFFAAMSFGNCGYAFPTMIGAKVAAPHRPAISYAGDGAWGMSLMETMTCVRHNIPVTAVVFHNRQWGAEKKNQVDFYNRRFVAGELDNQSFAGIARAMGAEGITVDKLEDVGPALKKAIDLQMNHGKTCIVEIMCTRELGDPFRSDALSKPVRFLEKYKDYV
jgi:sulfoacetaldehyde acetyltransferase